MRHVHDMRRLVDGGRGASPQRYRPRIARQNTPARAALAVVLLLLSSGCSRDDAGPTAAEPSRPTTTLGAAEAQEFESALRQNVNDAIGFATSVQQLHAGVVAGSVDAAALRARGGEFVEQIARAIEAVEQAPAPAAVRTAKDLATISLATYRSGAEFLAGAPDSAPRVASSSALRLKLVADATFDLARLLLRNAAGALSDRDRQLASSGVADFAEVDAEPDIGPAAGPTTAAGIRELAGEAGDIDAAMGSASEASERQLRVRAAAINPGGPDDPLRTLQLALVLGAESVHVRRAIGPNIADGVTALARDLWNVAAARSAVPPLT